MNKKDGPSKARRACPTDLSEHEWAVMVPLLAVKARTSRPRQTGFPTEIKTLRHLTRNSCEWRSVPNDFPLTQVFYYWLASDMPHVVRPDS